MTNPNISTRTLNHYAAHGINCHYVTRTAHTLPLQHRDVSTVMQFRRGRVDQGEAVQLEICITTHYAKRDVPVYATVIFDQATWAAIVEHVTRDRHLTRTGQPMAEVDVE